MFEYGGIIFTWLGQSGFFIRGQRGVCIDPYEVKRSEEKADLIICTHDHGDHCSIPDIRRFAKESTVILASESCRGKISGLKVKSTNYLSPGGSTEIGGVKVKAVPAYNVNKFRSPGRVHHPKDYLGIGVVLEMDGVRIYHSGDSDVIPEMGKLGEIDVALLAVSGTYVMTAAEAAEAVKVIRPKVAIPMHYGSTIGGVDDARKFRELAGSMCRVTLLVRSG